MSSKLSVEGETTSVAHTSKKFWPYKVDGRGGGGKCQIGV